MFILKKGHQPGVYVPLRALFLVMNTLSILLKTVNGNVYECYLSCIFISFKGTED